MTTSLESRFQACTTFSPSEPADAGVIFMTTSITR